MTKSIVLTAGLLTVLLGVSLGSPARADDSKPTARADDSKPSACVDGIARFGKVICSVGGEELVRAFFYAATSLDEVARVYPERLAKVRESCAKKATARRAPAGVEMGLRFEPIEACGGKRGYQEPCVRDEDCLENFCHADRGTCSAVFDVPVPFGN